LRVKFRIAATTLVKPSTHAAECLRQATECESQAERATDSTAKESFLDPADRWGRNAATFESIERVDRSILRPKE
jgi:hypothetical protein